MEDITLYIMFRFENGMYDSLEGKMWKRLQR